MEDFAHLYDFWFANPHYWFGSNSDQDSQIDKLFSHLFSVEINEELLVLDKKYGVGVILLYDQISKHIQRAKPNFLPIDSISELAQKYCLSVYTKWNTELTPNEFCFVKSNLKKS